MPRPQGYAVWFNGDIGVSDIEMDTYTCAHCCYITHVKPGSNDYGGGCFSCMGRLCDPCYDKRSNGGPCVPFEEKLKRIEEKHESRKSMGLIE